MEFYLHKDGQSLGPYDEATLRSFLANNQIQSSDLIYNDQMPGWATIESVFPPAPVALTPVGEDREVKDLQSVQSTPKKRGKMLAVKLAVAIFIVAAIGIRGWMLSPAKKDYVDFENLVEENGITYKKGESMPYTGTGKSFFPDGKTMKEVQFKDGKENGQMTTWYENGKISYKADFIAGEYEGEVATWSTNGVRQTISVYQNGNEISRKSWDENGIEIK